MGVRLRPSGLRRDSADMASPKGWPSRSSPEGRANAGGEGGIRPPSRCALRRDLIVSASHRAVARVRSSASEGGWRRGRDSNPRYPSGYSGFQDHRHRPLGHLSIYDRRGPLHPAWLATLRSRCAARSALLALMIGGAPCSARRSFGEGGHPAWLTALRSPCAARSAPFAHDRRGPLPGTP